MYNQGVKIWLAVFTFAFLIVGCSLPKSTPTPIITQVTPIYPTALPSTTTNPQPIITQTPDLTFPAGDLLPFLLNVQDLPAESAYYLPDISWVRRQPNSEVLREWGEAEGEAYLERTKRLDGAWISYKRGSTLAHTPDQVFCSVTMFETPEGPRLTLMEFNPLVSPGAAEVTYLKGSESFPDLGDLSLTYYYLWEDEEGEESLIYYIDAAYSNYLVSCAGFGAREDVSAQFIAHLVEILLQKIKQSPNIPPTGQVVS